MKESEKFKNWLKLNGWVETNYLKEGELLYQRVRSNGFLDKKTITALYVEFKLDD